MSWESAGKPRAFPFHVKSSGSVSSMSVYLDGHSGASDVIVGLYADAAGQPGALLTSGTIGSPQAGKWNTTQVSSAAVTAGQTYWIAAMGRDGTLVLRSTHTRGCGSREATQNAMSALPAVLAGRLDHQPVRPLGIRLGNRHVSERLGPRASGGADQHRGAAAQRQPVGWPDPHHHQRRVGRERPELCV